MFNNKVVTNNH